MMEVPNLERPSLFWDGALFYLLYLETNVCFNFRTTYSVTFNRKLHLFRTMSEAIRIPPNVCLLMSRYFSIMTSWHKNAFRLDLRCFLCCPSMQAVGPAVAVLVIRDAMTPMWRHYYVAVNKILIPHIPHTQPHPTPTPSVHMMYDWHHICMNFVVYCHCRFLFGLIGTTFS